MADCLIVLQKYTLHICQNFQTLDLSHKWKFKNKSECRFIQVAAARQNKCKFATIVDKNEGEEEVREEGCMTYSEKGCIKNSN